MRKSNSVEEIHIENIELLQRLIADLQKCDILYIHAPMGWGKYTFLADYYRKNEENIFWLEENEDICLEKQIEELPSAKKRIIIIPRLEKIMHEGKWELIWKIISDKKKEDVIVFAASIPFPKELIPYTLFYKVITYGVDDLKPSYKTVGAYFRKKGLILNNTTLKQIETDFNNMPLCIYLLENLLASGRKYSPSVREQCFEDVFSYLDVMLFRGLTIDEQDTVLRLSCFNDFNENTVAEVLDMSIKEAGIFVRKILERGSILVNTPGGWQFENLFGRFLKRNIHKYLDVEELQEMYYKAMCYFENKGNWQEAVQFAYTLQNEEEVARCLLKIQAQEVDYNVFIKLEDYFLSLSPVCLMKYPMLLVSGTILETVNGDLNKAEEYRRLLERMIEQMEQSEERKKLEEQIVFLQMINCGENKFEKLCEELKKVRSLSDQFINKKVNRFKPTNLSILHGSQDYCSLLADRENGKDNIKKIRALAEGVHDNIFGLMLNFAEAEVMYEQNKLEAALNILSCTFREAGIKRFHRMQQICTIAMADLLVARNQLDNMDEYFVQKVENDLKKGELFSDNVIAHQVYFHLLKGDKEKIMAWLQNSAPEAGARFYTCHYNQHLAKAKVYIWMERNVLAGMILRTLFEFAQANGMHYLEMQIRILQSIILYREGNMAWKEVLLPALEYGQSIHFVRVFADEGGAVYELLQEIAQKEGAWSDNEYIKELLSATRAHMLQYPNYLKQQKAFDVNEFSTYEKDVMKLLAQGNKNADIARKLFVSENTVKYHLKNIFLKLDVKNRSQAVNIIKEHELL